METLVRLFLEGLAAGRPVVDLLAQVGDPEPARSGELFASASRHPDLAGLEEDWVPALLASARPGYGAAALEALADQARESATGPLELRLRPALPRLLGSSNVLARWLLRHPERLSELNGNPPARPESKPLERDWEALIHAKYVGLIRIAARDLEGASFEESLQDLSSLADRCLEAALACAAAETGVSPPALLGLGKLGGQELNFSSDVDLLFLYDAPEGEADAELNRRVARVIRALMAGLQTPGPEGFGYRVDLDLRPEGPVGALANSVSAAIAYYETFGAEWERQMLIRLRYVAGPRPVAEQFEREILPFVYRRAIDPTVMTSVREMKLRIESQRRDAGHAIEFDLKEGPGGIRDVEFTVQALQLLHGGRLPEVRTGNVLRALSILAREGLLPEGVAVSLDDAYRWLRRAEHALQLVEERRTQEFPNQAGPQLALARRMGYADAEGRTARDRLLEDWTAVRAEVRQHFEALVLGSPR